MPAQTANLPEQPARDPRAPKTLIDRALSLFTDVRAGEGVTATLLLFNIFLLLICYSVIKTVREPLILLGGGAEVRSYAAAGQALLLMGCIPLYSWFASRVDRLKLIAGVTLFFVVCIEGFGAAVAARVPYVGVAFFVWVGIFNMSLVAQFWSFANDIYRKEAGDRLFPIIMVGMTAGAPLGSIAAARLFHSGIAPQVILQISALLLVLSLALYLIVNRREQVRNPHAGEALTGAAGGFRLVLASRYLRLIAGLVVLLNVVNTTGEYLVARLLTSHVHDLALLNPSFDKQAFIGTFSGEYQFWVNVVAFLLQAFATSRLVKHRGLQGALLALPLIALGGYSLIAAGASFAVVRWIKTAENATDYSIMNTARQLLWLPTTREEKYKAKQAIDTFFVRGGDVLSALVVYLGTRVLNLTVNEFAAVNVVLTVAWIGMAMLILKPSTVSLPRLTLRPIAGAAALLFVLGTAGPARAQDTRAQELADARAEKATRLHEYEPGTLERQLELADRVMSSQRPVHLVMGNSYEGAGFAFGPGYTARYGDTGTFEAHATWSFKNFTEAEATLGLPALVNGKLQMAVSANRLDAPSAPFYGVGSQSTSSDRQDFAYQTLTAGITSRYQLTRYLAVGGSLDAMGVDASIKQAALTRDDSPTYQRSGAFAEVDWRSSPGYTRNGGLLRVDYTDYRQINDGALSFHRIDAEAQQFIPLVRENWVLAFRALASTTDADRDNTVPYFLLPELGGSHSLRGYAPWQFRDRNRLLLTGEYRWAAGPFVDMALFVDAGKVAGRRSDLDFDGLRESHGIGMTIHTPTTTITRIELAKTREGLSLLFAFGPNF